MSVVRIVAAVLFSAVVGFVATAARAGDGFPPNGAWVYGSRPYGSVRSRATYWPRSTVYRTHYSGWGGYGNIGYGRVHYGSTARVHSRLNYWPHVSVPTRYYRPVHHYRYYPSSYYGYGYGYGYSPFGYSRLGYSGIGFSGIGFSTYGLGAYTSFSFPTLYYSSYRFPTVPFGCTSYPVVIPRVYSVSSPYIYSGATCSTTQTVPPVTYSVSRPLIDNTGSLAGQAADTGWTHQSASTQQAFAPAVGQTTVLDDAQREPKAVPSALLDAADAIFRAGGYREAATAYARLTVRFGPSRTLYGRRFIAQLASGEMSQAIVVSESAHLSNSGLRREDLPNGELAGLGLDAARIVELQEKLAAAALAQPDDASVLVAVSDWLRLCGDDAKADLFAAGAGELAGQPARQVQPSSKSELVSLE